jgi:hypothetical protein
VFEICKDKPTDPSAATTSSINGALKTISMSRRRIWHISIHEIWHA